MTLLKELRTIVRGVLSEPDVTTALAWASIKGKFASRLIANGGLSAARSVSKSGPLSEGPAISRLRRK